MKKRALDMLWAFLAILKDGRSFAIDYCDLMRDFITFMPAREYH
jgi:hypothetical protein